MKLLVALASIYAAVAQLPPDFEVVRQRALQQFGWPPVDQVPAVAQQALEYQTLLNSTCYFKDVNYDDPHDRANWLTFNHLTRLTTMVQALTAPTSPVFQQPALSDSVHCALGVWLDRDFVNDNW
jgi:hypothetical protein